MHEMKSSVRLVSGIFLSLSIISTVLACALWDFTKHESMENSLYSAGLLMAFLLNFSIFVSLLRAVATQCSHLFLPYLVCATFHLIISLGFVLVFSVSTIYSFFTNGDIRDLIGVMVFSICSVFWSWSIMTVRQYREYVQKTSGEHVLFVDEAFV